MDIGYRSLRIAVRAPRVALLVPVGMGWRARCENALSLASRFWGGLGTVLLPVVEGTVPSWFRYIVRMYDPDMLCPYPMTLGERALLDGTAEPVPDHLADAMVGWDDSGAVARVASWCSPFREVAHVTPSYALSGDDLGPALVDARTLLSPNTQLYDLDLDGVDPDLALRVRMRIGAVSNAIGEAVARHGGETVVLPVLPSDVPALRQFAVGEETVTSTWDLHSRFQSAKGIAASGPPPELLDLQRFRAGTAFSLTSRGLGWLTRVGQRHPPVIIAGDADVDFCLAQGLAVLAGPHAIPVVPAWVMGDQGSPAIHSVGRRLTQLSRRISPRGVPAQVVSASMSPDELGAFADEVSDALRSHGYAVARMTPSTGPFTGQAGEPGVVPIPLASLQVNRQVLADPERFAHPHASPATGSGVADAVELQLGVDPPKPSGVAWVDLHASWIVDVAIDGAQPPARLAIPERALLAKVVNDEVRVRASSHGIAFRSHTEFLTLGGWPLDLRLARPRLRVPSAYETFAYLLAGQSMTARPSQAGRLTASAAALWADLSAFASDLRGDNGALFDAFVGLTSRPVGVTLRGEQFLTLDHIAGVVGETPAHARSFVDRLSTQGVLRRGLILRCSRCNWPSFYRLASVGPGFACRRCDAHNALVQKAWKEPAEEPYWFYDLDHAVRAALSAGAAVPVAALDRLWKDHGSLLWMPEHEVVREGADRPVAEIDLWCIVDGKVLIGEAKSTPYLASNAKDRREILRKVTLVADAVDADIVCFATAARAWDETSEGAIREALDRSERELLLLTGLA